MTAPLHRWPGVTGLRLQQIAQPRKVRVENDNALYGVLACALLLIAFAVPVILVNTR